MVRGYRPQYVRCTIIVVRMPACHALLLRPYLENNLHSTAPLGIFVLPMRPLLSACLLSGMRPGRFVATSFPTPRTMSSSIPRDVQEFIAEYPTQGDNRHINDNLRFYRGELEAWISGKKYSIDSFHESWEGDYNSLGM
jgi:hypothetical protein